MIGVDTNVLVRWLVADEKVQHGQARRFIAGAAPDALFLSNIVLAELSWVLSRTYKFSQSDVLNTIETLLDMREFVSANRGLALEAAQEARQHGCEFADALIGILNRDASCTSTVTFDRKARRLSVMTSLDTNIS